MRIGKPDAGFKFRILNTEFNWLPIVLISPLGLACATTSSISRLLSLINFTYLSLKNIPNNLTVGTQPFVILSVIFLARSASTTNFRAETTLMANKLST